MRYDVARRFVNAIGVLALSVVCGSAAAGSLKLVVLGDSLTAGHGLHQSDAFPNRLQAALRRDGLDVTVINAGVSGDTTTGGLSRLDWALSSSGGPPDAVIVELGANDGLRGLDPALTRANLDAIITRIRAKGIAVLLAGMVAPPNLGRDFGAEFNAVFPDLADRHRILLYPFFLDGVAAVPDLNQADGLHPNARGVAVVVERILPYVKKLLSNGS